MSTCSICYERFNYPVSLPCGHVFCQECIRRTVDSTKSSGAENSCPTCRATFSILNVDPTLIPAYLRPHIQPPLRPLFLDSPGSMVNHCDYASTTNSALKSITTPPTGSTNTASPIASTSASASASVPTAADAKEITALHLTCATWRRQAEMHASANTNLLAFARTARDCALRLRVERDALRNECVLLKRKLAEMQAGPSSLGSEHGDGDAACKSPSRPSSSGTDKPHYAEKEARVKRRNLAPTGIPLYVMQFQSQTMHDANTGMALGPPMKRRKMSPSVIAPPVCEGVPETAD